MFSLIGAMMVVYGVATGNGAEIYQRSLGINVNICWGSLLLIFGATMLVFAWRGGKKSGPPADPGQ
jgi:uncharacterized protein YhhL (DUF1145 family)